MEGSESYKRLAKSDKGDKIFLPINIDGVEQVDHFMTIPKLVTLGCVLLVLVVVIMTKSGWGRVLGISVWFLLAQFIVRRVVFEEKRYYKAYKQRQKIRVGTPAEFFKITAVRDTPAGSVIIFSNGQVGVLVKLERGTVVGRPLDFMGEHYDAMSEMYRALLRANLKFLIMDICDASGNESTVDGLGRLTVNSSNKNIAKLMELEVGYIKNIVNDTIYSKDYLLIYTDASRVGSLISDVEDALNLAFNGAIAEYKLLNQDGLSAFVSEYFGVGFFSGEDVLRVGVTHKAFKVVGVDYDDGVHISLGDEERKQLEKQVKLVGEGKYAARQLSLRRVLSAQDSKLYENEGFITDIPQMIGGVLYDASESNMSAQGASLGNTSFSQKSAEEMSSEDKNKFPSMFNPSVGAFNSSKVGMQQGFGQQPLGTGFPTQGFSKQQSISFPQQNVLDKQVNGGS